MKIVVSCRRHLVLQHCNTAMVLNGKKEHMMISQQNHCCQIIYNVSHLLPFEIQSLNHMASILWIPFVNVKSTASSSYAE